MATIGTLAVNLITNIGGFTKPLKTAEGQLGGFAGNLSKLSPIAANAVNSLLPLVGTLALVHTGMAKLEESFARLDALGKLSDQTGFVIDDLRALRLGAEFAGSSVESMDKTLLMFTRRLGEAKAGLGEGRHALEELNLTAENLAGMGMGNALRTVADRISRMTSEVDQQRIAYQLMGRDAIKNLAVFQQGSEGIGNLVAEVVRLQGSFDDLDVDKIEEANDSFVRMEKSIDGLVDRVSFRLAPAMEGSLDRSITVLGVMGKVLEGMGWVVDTFWGTLLEWHPAFILAGKGLEKAGIVDGTEEVAGNVAKAIENQVLLNDKFEEAGMQLEKNSELQKFANSLIEQAKTPLEIFHEEIDRIREARGASLIDMQTFFRSMDAARDKLESTFDKPVEITIDPVLEGIRGEVEQLFEQTRTPFERYEAEVNRILDLFGAWAIDVDLATRGILQAQDQLKSLTAGPDGDEDKGRDLVAGPAALRKGSSEAFSAILAAGRQNDKPQQQTAQNTKVIADKQDDLLEGVGNLLRAFNNTKAPKPIQIAGG